MKARRRRDLSRPLALASVVALASAACTALLDIDGIEFGEPVTGGSGGAATGGQAQGGSTAGSGGSLTGGGGQGGTLLMPESCGNGVDDDGDGLTDCEDDDCSCAPAPPAGFVGPFAFFPGTLGGPVFPGCDDAFPVELDGGQFLLNQPATCDACACDAPAGVTCDLPGFRPFGGGNCGGPNSPVPILAPDVCQMVTLPGGTDSVAALPPTVSGGSCSASGGAATLPPPNWFNPSFVCEAPTGQCAGGGGVCMPVLAAPFKTCVRVDGSSQCPAGPYSEAHPISLGVVDTRDCTACGCGAPGGVQCTGLVDVYADPLCSFLTGSTPADGSCMPNTQAFDAQAIIYHPDPPAGGSCTPNGGAPTGALAAATTVTVCCIP